MVSAITVNYAYYVNPRNSDSKDSTSEFFIHDATLAFTPKVLQLARAHPYLALFAVTAYAAYTVINKGSEKKVGRKIDITPRDLKDVPPVPFPQILPIDPLTGKPKTPAQIANEIIIKEMMQEVEMVGSMFGIGVAVMMASGSGDAEKRRETALEALEKFIKARDIQSLLQQWTLERQGVERMGGTIRRAEADHIDRISYFRHALNGAIRAAIWRDDYFEASVLFHEALLYIGYHNINSVLGTFLEVNWAEQPLTRKLITILRFLAALKIGLPHDVDQIETVERDIARLQRMGDLKSVAAQRLPARIRGTILGNWNLGGLREVTQSLDPSSESPPNLKPK